MVKVKRSMLSLMIVIGLVINIFILPVNTVYASLKNVSINPEIQYQEFDGWGTCLAWWAGQVGGWSEKTKKELMDLIFGKNGLELNIVRYNIGGGENPDCPYNKIGPNGEKIPHMHFGRDMEGFSKGYDQNTNQIIWKWDADKNQREILKLTKEYNVDIYEAQSNSPPYWMTYTQCAAGNGGRDNLKPEYYGLFAEYLTEVVKHIYEEDGIKFQYLDPLNEPSASWWNAGGTQEGCHFDLESQAKIIEEVYNKAREKGLDIKIVAPDESIIDTCIQTVLYYKDNNILQYVDRINTHTYGGSKRYQLRDLVRSIGKKLWVSEFSTGYIADDHQKMAPALPLAWTILHDIKDMGASAWVIWQAVENEVENYYDYSNNKLWNPPGSWGLIHAAYHDMDLGNGIRFSKEQYWITKQYYVMAQFSKFIKKGYKIIDISDGDSIAAYGDKDKKLVIVTLNVGDTKKYFNYDLSKFNLSNDSVLTVYRTSDDEALYKLEEITLNNDSFSYEIKENSVTTFVISNVKYEGPIGDKINDNVTGPTYFSYSNGWSYYDQQSGAYSNDVHYSNIKDAYITLTFKGTSIFLYGAKAPDQGIIAVSVDNNPEEFIDCYHNTRQDGVLIYKNTNLQYGNHTLKIRITGNKNDNATNTYFTLDYAIIYNMPYYNNQIKPKITNVFSYNNRVRIIFEPIDGATEYIVKYGEKPNKLNNIIRGIHDNVVDIYALRNSGRYYFAISAIINGYETTTSNVVGINVTDKTDNTLLYYVDCGANTLLPGDVLGSRNSVIDQEYGYDPLTGYKWGYITDNGTWNNGENDRFRRIRQNDGGREGQGITYKFEVPAGMYRITLGFNDPWGNSARKQDVLINNKLVLQDYVPPPRNDVKIFDGIYVNDNTLSISILRSKGNNGRYENPIISWIRVEKISQEIPDPPTILSIEKGSKQITVNIRESNGADFYKIYIGKDPNSFDKIIKVPNNTLNPTITGLSYDVDYYLTATAVNKYGESLKSNVVQVKLKREVAEPNLMYYANAGDSTPNTLEIYGNIKEECGYLQSVEDQNYGRDNVTGYYWGNIEEGTGTGTWDDSNINNPLLRPIRWKKDDNGSNGINYTFELPNGIYNVEIGARDPWGQWGKDRYQQIYINGQLVDDTFIPTDNNGMIRDYNNIIVKNNKMEIRIVRKYKSEPILSFIKIYMVKGIAFENKYVNAQVNDVINLNYYNTFENASIEFSSSNPDVVEINNGQLYCRKPGISEITAKVVYDGEQYSTSCTINVSDNMLQRKVEKILLDKDTISVNSTVYASIYPEDIESYDINWYIPDTSVANIIESNNKFATVSINSTGKTKLIAKLKNDESIMDYTIIKNLPRVIKIDVQPDEIILNNDEAGIIKWVTVPEECYNNDYEVIIDNHNIVEVSGDVIRAKSSGTTTIKVINTLDPAVYDTVKVTVMASNVVEAKPSETGQTLVTTLIPNNIGVMTQDNQLQQEKKREEELSSQEFKKKEETSSSGAQPVLKMDQNVIRKELNAANEEKIEIPDIAVVSIAGRAVKGLYPEVVVKKVADDEIKIEKGKVVTTPLEITLEKGQLVGNIEIQANITEPISAEEVIVGMQYDEQKTKWIPVQAKTVENKAIITVQKLGKVIAISGRLEEIFSDISNKEWWYDSLKSAVSKGLLVGYTDMTLRPNKNVTVLEGVVLVCRAFDLKPSITQKTKNVPSWARNSVDVLINEGVLDDAILAKISGNLTRAEACEIIIKMIEKLGVKIEPTDIEFKDVSNISSEKMIYLKKAYKVGIIKGYPDKTVKPEKTITRAELITMILRAINVLRQS